MDLPPFESRAILLLILIILNHTFSLIISIFKSNKSNFTHITRYQISLFNNINSKTLQFKYLYKYMSRVINISSCIRDSYHNHQNVKKRTETKCKLNILGMKQFCTTNKFGWVTAKLKFVP